MTIPPRSDADLEARLRAYYRQRRPAPPDSEALWSTLVPYLAGSAPPSYQPEYQEREALAPFPSARPGHQEPRMPTRPQPRRPRRLFSWIAATAAVLVIAVITTALVASHHPGNSAAPSTSPTAQMPQDIPPSGVYFSTMYYGFPQDEPPSVFYALAPGDGSVKWQFGLPGESTQVTPTLDNGVLYETFDNSKQDDSTLYAVSASNGKVLWQHDLGDQVDIPPVVQDGVVYLSSPGSGIVGGPGGTVFAVNASDGSLRWQQQLEGEPGVPHVVNGVVYLGVSIGEPHGATGMAYALNASDGSVRWQIALQGEPQITVMGNQLDMFETGQHDGATEGSPVVTSIFEARSASDGSLRWSSPDNAKWYGVLVNQNTIYAMLSDPQQKNPSSVEALNASTGAVRWRAPIANADFLNAIVVGNLLYFTTYDTQGNTNALYALDTSSGAVRWRTNQPEWVDSIIDNAGSLYIAGATDISALNGSTGALQWRYPASGGSYLVLAVRDQVVYALSARNSGDTTDTQSAILAINASTGKLLWRYDIASAIVTPIVG